MSAVNVFIGKLQRWRKDIRESGPLACWLTAVWTLARNAPEQLQKRQAKGNRKEKMTFIIKCLMYIFLKYIINVADFLETVANFEFSLSYSCSAPRY